MKIKELINHLDMIERLQPNLDIKVSFDNINYKDIKIDIVHNAGTKAVIVPEEIWNKK